MTLKDEAGPCPMVAVVLPTYNERANLASLLPTIDRVLSAAGYGFHVLVVDDDSPDGTAFEVEQAQLRGLSVTLVRGQRAGLGLAYIRGFEYALTIISPDIVVQMDADFSHIPSDLPRLIAALDAQTDLVIGSRYVDGDRTLGEWGWFRRALSHIGNRVSRQWLGLESIADCTGGFRVWRADYLASLLQHRMDVSGYGFQVVLLQRAKCYGGRIRELPVEFPPRSHGRSKLRWFDVIEFAGWLVIARWRGRCTR